ncbi:zinc finger CCCH domain-containing protein 18-like [Hylaeus volcanicus]|uniref:zinc finger CCCH domain-containing protein 18-like n=1 Tax=Hylaeus volcanicus TaxID=313075 RepID=UPI0023B78E90|nr:zinc finger CCCH domain-containing protein 18-like [Hylaeus volcanicus]XP_053980947.1 zinc finger CCCH domain-containing protein 18-like [Hylaeus volcanicus]XP_053980948.1 zinc finger CCCH domain-containing protein 18-like [Hylaeus volcanicus]XP_053980950.1 zinc finger CCCH domain-containing protein 18-like [Hylaeus volcanicus]
MSDSGSESSSSEGYDRRRNPVTSTNNVGSPNSSHHSSLSGRKSRASSLSSRGKSPESIISERDSKSPRYTPISPKSQRSGLASPSEDEGSPRSTRSLSKSPPTTPKSYRSRNNSLDSPRSDHSLSRSPIQDERSCLSTPNDSKSLHMEDTEPKQFELEVDAQRSGDNSPKSCSYKNSESRQSSPKSPRSGRSSVKSLISGRSSPKSGPASPMDDQESEKHSSPHSPATKSGSFNELDGEQISDGDIEDEPESVAKSKPAPITHGEDLSDVSDLESMDGVDGGTEHESELKKGQQNEERHATNNDDKIEKEDKNTPVGLTEENEQLDFEADGQWKDERDEGETEGPITKENKDDKDGKDKDKVKSKDGGEANDKEEGEEDGEKVESELEEGELSDGDDARPEETEPRPVCRFYNRGQCTWGVSCRFLHPGVTDKGNYTMFDMVRPMAYPPHAAAPHEFRPHIDRPNMVRPLPGYGAPSHTPKVEELPTESAWERGLRHAKEMMRKANKRKESDMDFEEKKMNLSLGQDELDREAGYYVRAASPEPPAERWPPREAPRRMPPPRITPERYIEEPDPYYAQPTAPPEYYRRVHYKADTRVTTEYRERIDYHPVPRGTPHSVSPPPHTRERERERERERDREREYYEKYEKKHKRPSREVIVERIPPTKPWREEEPPQVERSRGDEWADPWMRRKSPSAVRRNTSRRSRRQSYSSGSSYSSTSSSRSSSRSSYSSYDSLSRSRSPSPPSRTRGAGKGKAAATSPPSNPPTVTAAAPQRGAMLMNPPAPSPRPPKGSISPTTGTLHRRAGLNPPAPSPLSSHQRHHEKARDKAAIAAAAVAKVIKSRSRSRSSHSSSGSESSGSSSDSSESSYSSSSSETRRRKGSTPPITRKDSKGIDALKLSGTKQQIKLTLKPTSNTAGVKKIDRSALMAGKKRGLESPPLIDSKASVAAAAAKAAKKASSRREELLKQLKAVEDAIARKRSKV